MGCLVLLSGLSALGELPVFPPVTAADRLLVVAPHPDDDVLGAGGLIQHALSNGANVRIVYLTNGDHNQVAFKIYTASLRLRPRDYIRLGERREDEARTGAKLLGLAPEQLTFLGYPDWGTLRIWRDYWEPGEVFVSDATHTNAVPYPDAFRPGQLYQPQNVVADLRAILREYRPTGVFVTHPADTNPDHRAAANFVRLALLDVSPEGVKPALHYYLIHFGSWPRPLHYHPDIPLAAPAALRDDGPWRALPVTLEQAARKHQAIHIHRTQLVTRQYYLEAFARASEIFADHAPERVPVLPATDEPDWRRAIRAKHITVAPGNGDNSSDLLMLEQIEFLRQNGDLIVVAGLKNRLGKRPGVHLYLFGYKPGTAFAGLPKLHLRISPFGNPTVVRDGQRLTDHGVRVTGVGGRYIAHIPMTLLGGTDITYLFTSARANFGSIRSDDSAWQLLQLEPIPQGTN